MTYSDSIFKLPLNHTPTTLHSLRERYNELCTRSQTLPYMFNIRTPAEFDLDLVSSYLPHNFFASLSESTTAEINKVAFLMAVFGWQGHIHDRLGAQLGSLSCHACFRVLGLWLFKSKEVNEAGEEIIGPAMNGLDVITEHRDYCPWRNPASQNGLKATSKPGKSAMAGWEIVIRVLKNDHHLRHTGEKQAEKATVSVSDIETQESMFGADDDEDEKSIREEKDKERWARLRKVKSLFDTKAGKKLQRSGGAVDPKINSRT